MNKEAKLMLGSVEAFVAALRSTPLLPDDQTTTAVSSANLFSDVQEYAKYLVRQKILSLYQAKKILANRTHELVIGSYVVVDKLGEGGMGKVYKAIQTRMKRLVALKVVKASLLKNEIALKRFQREMKAASSLTHPNIVRVFDADQIGDRYFLAMEYIEGPDLSKLVKENGPLDIGTACSLVRQTALGLQHAHEMGIVHRDIKPSNILVSLGSAGSLGPSSQAKILDMGLARAISQDDDSLNVTELTRAGTVVGTPDYMSPEQAKNSSLVDGRSDLYSLGCTLFYLITGEVVFPNGNALEKLMSHQMDSPRSSQLIRFDVPTEVDQIIQTLLAKKPSERFQSGNALAQALAPFCRGENASVPSTILVAEAVEGEGSGTVTTNVPPRDPFDFAADDTVRLKQVPVNAPETPKTTSRTKIRPSTFREGLNTAVSPSVPNTPTTAQPNSSSPNPKSRRLFLFLLLIAIGVLFTIGIVVLVVSLTSSNNPDRISRLPSTPESSNPNPPSSEKNEKNGWIKREILKPETLEPFVRYCPDTTMSVLTLDLKKIANGSGSRHIMPRLKENLAAYSKLAEMELSEAIERITFAITPFNENDANDINENHILTILQGHHFVDNDSRKRFSNSKGVASEIIVAENPSNGTLFSLKTSTEPPKYFALFDSPSVVVTSSNRDLVIEAIHKKIGLRTTKFIDESLSASLNRALFTPVKHANVELVMAYSVKQSWGLIEPKAYSLEGLYSNLSFDLRGLTIDMIGVGTESSFSDFIHDLSEQIKFAAKFTNHSTTRLLNSIAETLNRGKPIEGKFKTPRVQHLRFLIPNDKLDSFLEPFFGQNIPMK